MERESCFSLTLSAVSPRQGLANPMADSTQIERALTTTLTPKLNRLHSLHGSDREREGEGRSISPSQRSNSFSSLNIGSPNKRLTDLNWSTSSSTINRQKLNLSQLDPRTYANVNSTGFASRIAKYHDTADGGRLQRSISVNNLSSSMVRPRRSVASPLPYKATMPKISVTRIAPPERSFYSGNSLSSLLRSNSVVGVVHKIGEQQGQEQLSRENRPILHPPPTQQEIEPTRSVLEELKEISRKRINTGEPHSPHDFAKKRMSEFVDSHTHPHQAGPSHQMTASFKRQRETQPLTVTVPLRQQHNVPVSPAQQHLQQSNAVAIPTLSTPQQLSPEQQAAKRRICSYNNDIASSLSSSRRQNHKRKLYDMKLNQSQSITGNQLSASCESNSQENSPTEHAAKIQRKIDLDAVCKTLSMPATTTVAAAVPPPRMHSAPTEVDGVIQSDSTAPVPKPKLTLFNAQQKSQPQQQQQEDLNSPEVEASEYAGIQFVKPKKQNSGGVGLGKNPAIERMQKTKLAIMLSGLRGEIYIGESEDDIDAPQAAPPKLTTPIKPIVPTIQLQATTPTITATTSTTTTKSSETALPKPNTESKLQASSTAALVLGKPSTSAPIAAPTGEKTATTTATSATALTTAATTVVTSSPTTAATTAAPFTFGNSIKEATASMNKPVTTSSGSNGTGLVGNEVTIKPTDTLTTTTGTVNPTVTFKTISNSPTTAVTSSSTPALLSFGGASAGGDNSRAMFSFGNSTANPTTTSVVTTKDSAVVNTTATTIPTTTSTVFTFGGGNGTTLAPISTAPATSTTAGGTTPTASTFGQLNKANSTSSANGSSTNSGFGGYSFGGTAAAPVTNAQFGNQPNSFANSVKQPEKSTSGTATAAVKPIFGSPANSSFANAFKSPEANPNATTVANIAASQEPGKAFSFTASATTTPSAQPSTTTTNLFSFGATDTSKPAEQTSTTSNVFGQNLFEQKPAAATSTPFAFGGAKPAATTAPAASTAPSSPFSFGGAKPAAPVISTTTATSLPFSFGGAKTASAGSSGATEKSTPFAFGGSNTVATASSTATNKSTPFSFGGSNPVAIASSAATEKSTPFSFGGSSSVAPAPSAVNEKSTPFSFGGGKPAASSSSSNNLFSFGGAATQAPAATSANNAAGSVPSSNSPFSFGAAVQKPASVFGSQASSTEAASGPATTVKPFAFGGGGVSSPAVKQQQAQTNPVPAAGSFSFGSALNKNNGESNGGANIFGASTGVVKPSFSFGDNNTNVSSTPAPTQSSNFGQFGAAPAASNNQSKPFNFGGNTSTSAVPPLGGNLFANAVSAAQFGATSALTTATQNSNASAKPFNFGGAQPTSNVFSSPAPAAPATKPGTAFQFGSAASSPAMSSTPQQVNANNIFAPPPSVPENRPFRRATRRLQK